MRGSIRPQPGDVVAMCEHLGSGNPSLTAHWYSKPDREPMGYIEHVSDDDSVPTAEPILFIACCNACCECIEATHGPDVRIANHFYWQEGDPVPVQEHQA